MDSNHFNQAASELAKGIISGNRIAVSRAISLAEDSTNFAAELLSNLGRPKGETLRIGITGPPGVGKSTIVAGLIPHLIAQKKKVGALLVDPTSPLSGGAVLGDRIRLHSSSESDSVYVRSMASRGSLGGISASTGAALRILEHWGADIVIVESVGIGQLGSDIASLADVVFLVLAPGAGDAIQTMKSGIIETADVFAINKADLPGVPALMANLEADARGSDGSLPRILTLTANSGDGITAIWDVFVKVRAEIISGPEWPIRAKKRAGYELKHVLQSLLMEHLFDNKRFTGEYDNLVRDIFDEKADIYTSALNILKKISEYLYSANQDNLK